MPVIQQVFNKAMIFALSRAGATASSVIQMKEFRDLFDAVSQLNANELGCETEQLLDNPMYHYAPVIFSEIHQNEHLSASVFTVRPNRELPLHDHPGMFGILKVIYGKIRILSYSYLTATQRAQLTEAWDSKSGGERIGKLFKQSVNRWEEKNVMPVIEHPPRTLSADDPPSILTPNEYNIHRVQAVDEGAAFFDILMPPYYPSIPGRDCHYYNMLDPKETLTVSAAEKPQSILRQRLEEIESSSEKEESPNSVQQSPTPQKVTWLIRIPPPHSYFCESAEYMGPLIKSMTEVEFRAEMKKKNSKSV